MKATAIIVALLLMLSGDHVTMRFAGNPVTVPVPVLVLAAELAVCAVLCWLIRRAVRASYPHPYRQWRTS